MEEDISYIGTISLKLLRKNDEGKWFVAAERKRKNLLLNGGRDYLIKRIMDDGTAPTSGTACHAFTVGTTLSAGSPAATDTTATDTEIARAAFTYATGGIGACSATATFETGTAVGSITEAGIYAGGVTSGDGVFFARAMFTAVNKLTTDRLQVKWDVSFA